MKPFNLLGIAVIFCISCKKETSELPSPEPSLIQSSRSFFEKEIDIKPDNIGSRTIPDESPGLRKNPRKKLVKQASWDKASIIEFAGGRAVLVPVQYNTPFIIKSNFSGNALYSINQLTKLLVYQDSKKKYQAELVTYFPDSNYSKNSAGLFSGIAVIEDWAGNLIKEYKFDGKGGIQKLDLAKFQSYQADRAQTSYNQSIITVCYEISGYNYSPSTGEYYYWSYSGGCSSMFVQDFNGGGEPGGSNYGDGFGGGSGGGGGYVPPVPTFTLVRGENAITNISEYTKCFTNTAGNTHSYNISLCVSQPEEGSRGSWETSGAGSMPGGGGLISVGHAFLIFSEASPTGSIVRNVGFYPANDINPLSPETQGQLNNDANHEFNISLNISVTSSQFFQALNFISQGNDIGYLYNLNSNNCTTFALNALGSAGINLPRTNGSWLNGGGLNPGDLGEDIRGMELPSNMTRTTVSGTHPNVGSCY